MLVFVARMTGMENDTVSMNALLLVADAVALPSVAGLVHIFIVLAIVALIVWGVIALIRYAGWTIPQPVWIVLTVLGGIFLIVFLARVFGYAI
jgi:hypothetical protein